MLPLSFATSKNLTILGIVTILLAVGNAVLAVFDGDSATNVDLNWLFTQILLGVNMIMSKGQANTGGIVPVTEEAVERTKVVP
jgi:hypothetical protein